ncbi:TetR/AcrR family transcriptional regulator [Mesobacillus sp. AQ2]|jgi:AcrR family transcriptional regulator|uniref:TetR/AcrR family transcriptional regulator n=1 Tax=Bacillaceae TaxID=186817 RepID=UPI00119EA1CD|nr:MULTISPECIES: TetR/AcrR family transcriptional regulator [Bacillaceae]MCM3121546.1 TetR/AcrR family transcriptional regulator [Mesobacillus sp. MER 33]MCM3231510.1 TetR/AcrR family transcriptional regulator [Mesobacillus sp. MER 48]WHX38491.1 TetR/AcrR family transcriptional regulator [Mesobacillus sp. AQ2]
MNDRKRNVIEKAHELFIEKGFHSTSIQDILDYSGISKGTFYNYFLSKNELLMEIFRAAFRKMEMARDALLLGQDPGDPEVFMRQIELQMTANRENKIIPLFEEVYFSGDKELKQFIEIGQMKTLRWYSDRLADITDDLCRPYLLDAAIMLNGILIQNVRFYRKANGDSASMLPIVRFSVNRILNLIEEVTLSQEQLLSPEFLDAWLPVSNREALDWRSKIHSGISRLKKLDCENKDHLQKLNFIEEELRSKAPRKFLVDSILFSMSSDFNREIQELQALIDEHFLEKA